MKRFRCGVLVLVAILIFAGADAFAAGFIKFDGVNGESTDKDHEKWIDVLSWSSETEANQGVSRRCGPIKRSLSFTKWVDSSSPELLRLAETCDVQQEVVLEVPIHDPNATPGVQRVMIIRMHDVTVTRVIMRDSPDDEAPKEKVDLNFSAADVEVVGVDSDGGTRD